MKNDTICALATPAGISALAIIRVSGPQAFSITSHIFKGPLLEACEPNTVQYGHIMDGNEVLDEVLISVFKSPRSFTKENIIEISCHGSSYISQRIIELLIVSGARLADPGEFTLRAWLNGRIDLTKAEAIMDLISSENKTQQQLAMNQMKGALASEIQELRTELIDLCALLELELDFGEEDVEFADRTRIKNIITTLSERIEKLRSSFRYGNAIKSGVPVVIAGRPNAGKSSLLNLLIGENRAIVSDIPGTTRDTIEEVITIANIRFRFIDTAGLRDTEDPIEKLGIQKTYDTLKKAGLIIYLADLTEHDVEESVEQHKNHLQELGIPFLVVWNKLDAANKKHNDSSEAVLISVHEKTGIELLKDKMLEVIDIHKPQGSVVIQNLRHWEALNETYTSLHTVLQAIEMGLSSDLLAMDIRRALLSLGRISGQVDVEEVLGSIFSRFCIGK